MRCSFADSWFRWSFLLLNDDLSKAAMATPSEVPFEELKTSFFRLRVAVDTLRVVTISRLSEKNATSVICRVEEAADRLGEDGALLLGLKLRAFDIATFQEDIDLLLALLSILRSMGHLHGSGTFALVDDTVVARQEDVVGRVHRGMVVAKGVARHLIKRWPRRSSPIRGLAALSRVQRASLQELVDDLLVTTRLIQRPEAPSTPSGLQVAKSLLEGAESFLRTPGLEFHHVGLDIFLRAATAVQRLQMYDFSQSVVVTHMTDNILLDKLLAELRPPGTQFLYGHCAAILDWATVALAATRSLNYRQERFTEKTAQEAIRLGRQALAGHTNPPSMSQIRHSQEGTLSEVYALAVFKGQSAQSTRASLTVALLSLGAMFFDHRRAEAIAMFKEAIDAGLPAESSSMYRLTLERLSIAHSLLAHHVYTVDRNSDKVIESGKAALLFARLWYNQQPSDARARGLLEKMTAMFGHL